MRASVPLTPSPNLESVDFRLSESVLKLMPVECPIDRRACRLCSTHPSGLVNASLGLSFRGMCFIFTVPLACQSVIAKQGIEICRDRSVGATDSIVF